MRSEASACNVPYHKGGVAAGESRTNTVPKKKRNDKKSKKSVSLISDTCGCRELFLYSRIDVVSADISGNKLCITEKSI